MHTMTETQGIWQYVENAPMNAWDVADLWHWSTNYDPGCGPFALFLDIIGFSDENYGTPLYAPTVRFSESRPGMSSWDEYLGYVEIDKLGAALRQYALNPNDVRAWIEKLMQYDEA